MPAPLQRGRAGLAKKCAILTASFMVALPTAAVADPQLPFRNPHLSLNSRLDDLISRLTIDEKISLLHQYEPGIDRLGIKPFKTGTEALHGVAWLGTSTVFPQALGLATTWDPALIKNVGNAVGQEARGFNSENPAFNGLNLWAPVVNLLRDPRWGRNEEGYSEDPYLTGAISVAYGKGMEGDNPNYLQAAPTLKHYLAYNNEVNRDTSDSIVPKRILKDYDELAFKPAISSGAAVAVMPSYNLVNGRPNTVSPELNNTIRSWTANDVAMVSDAGAPSNLVNSEAYYADKPTAVAAAIKAGLDSFTDNDADPTIITAAIKTALTDNLLTVADIEKADRPLLAMRFRLGEFDPAGLNPYASIGSEAINSKAHQELALQAAQAQMVLLKNDKQSLPLSSTKDDKVAVVGPLSDVLYSDWYSGTMPYKVTPLQGVKDKLGANGTVYSSEGVDRIALKDVTTGKYLTASTDTVGGNLAEGAATVGNPQKFDVFDWGAGKQTLRAVANGKYLSLGGNHNLINNADQPNGWYVQQQLSLVKQSDGNYVLEYMGNDASESWFGTGKYAVVGSDGTLTISANSPDKATKFSKDVVTSGIDEAVAQVKKAKKAVVVLGSMPFINGREANDRTSTALPAAQEDLIKAVLSANPNTTLVMENSYPDTINWEKQNVPSIVWTTHAGEETGHALADVLFGDYNPSGHLTQTWYADDSKLPSILNYDISKTQMTYQYYQGTPLYPFGYGLSYTNFAYRNLKVSPYAKSDGTIQATVDVTNTGSKAGADVVQLYAHQRTSRFAQPQEELRSFAKVDLKPGETKSVQLSFAAKDLASYDVTREKSVVETGLYDLRIGANATDIQLTAPAFVAGEVIPSRDLSKVTKAENFDDYSGITLTDTSKASGTSVAGTGWAKFAQSDLGAGFSGISASVSNSTTTATTITVRADDPNNGQVLGSIAVPAGGDKYAYSTVNATLAKLAGKHDIYLIFPGGAALSTFQLVK